MNKKNLPFIVFICLMVSAIIAVGGFLSLSFFLFSSEIMIEESPEETPTDSSLYHFDYSWAENQPYIAHAMGGVLGHAYTNSYEAFLLNYQLGQRVFEIDLYLTTDDQVVATHDAASWADNTTFLASSTDTPPEFTHDNFLSSLWYNQFHPIDLPLLIDLLQEYPDIHIITDTKYTDEPTIRQQFAAILAAAKKVDLSLLDRLIPQFYHPEMLAVIMDLYDWKSVIYTLYNDPNWTPENVLAFSEFSGVKFITMRSYLATAEILDLWSSAGIRVGVHTVNNLSDAKRLLSLGVSCIYTDFLLPSSL